MIEKVHEHIIAELQQNTRTDTIFILTAILLNLITLAVNSAIGAVSSREQNAIRTIIMFIFAALVIVINGVVIQGLLKGRETRAKLVGGLLRMYQDQGVSGYYDLSLLGNYSARYNLFILAVIFTGIVALIVPFVATLL